MKYKIIFFLYSMTISIKPDCICGPHRGDFCGEWSNDGSSVLKGSCDSNFIYRCQVNNSIAQQITNCVNCKKNNNFGNDYCALAKESKIK